MISSRGSEDFYANNLRFQSRNRGSFDFKSNDRGGKEWDSYKFQSRNRGSFDFKPEERLRSMVALIGFNLVIEVLLISRNLRDDGGEGANKFQSRNRGSFDFKLPAELVYHALASFQSRNRGSFDFKEAENFAGHASFHLVSIS